MKTEVLLAYDKSDDIKALFAEYMDMLVTNDPPFAEYLKLQKYDQELQDLTQKYGLPHGRLYILYCDGAPAGCIGFRKLDQDGCEMKRLYIKPEYRRRGFARMLVEKILADAREIGYKYMYLDTLPFLKEAIALYFDLGFFEIDRYNDSPMANSVYMKLAL